MKKSHKFSYILKTIFNGQIRTVKSFRSRNEAILYKENHKIKFPNECWVERVR